jgi:hypothetical protein
MNPLKINKKMPVYVDCMNAVFRNMVMCHMVADTSQELLDMADKIGIQRKWIQDAGTKHEHFDVCLSKKKLAIKHGAIEIGWRELIEIQKRKN